MSNSSTCVHLPDSPMDAFYCGFKAHIVTLIDLYKPIPKAVSILLIVARLTACPTLYHEYCMLYCLFASDKMSVNEIVDFIVNIGSTDVIKSTVMKNILIKYGMTEVPVREMLRYDLAFIFKCFAYATHESPELRDCACLGWRPVTLKMIPVYDIQNGSADQSSDVTHIGN